MTRDLLGFLPSNNMEEAPRRPTTDDPQRACPELTDFVPVDSSKPYAEAAHARQQNRELESRH